MLGIAALVFVGLPYRVAAGDEVPAPSQAGAAATLGTPGATAAPASSTALSSASARDREENAARELPRGDSDGRERPWAAGISLERQNASLELFREGNTLLKESLFRQSADKYRQALAHWDHPGIHYNLALALLNLDQPLEVREHLQAALKYGPEPLDLDKFNHAQSYLKLVEKQLTPMDVQCDEPEATVSLDGRVLFRAPGRYQGFVRPGPHTVVAAKEGYPPTERNKVAVPGEPAVFQLKLYAAGELIRYRRRWPLWWPITVTGAGAVMLGTAVGLNVMARNRLVEFDQAILTRNDCSAGCEPGPELANAKSRGEAYQTAATVLYVTGGLTAGAGVVLMVLNSSTPYRVDPAERAENLSVAPFFAAGTLGVVGSGRF